MRRLALLPLALALSAPALPASAGPICVNAGKYGGSLGSRGLVHFCAPSVGDELRTRCYDIAVPSPDGGHIVAWWCIPPG